MQVAAAKRSLKDVQRQLKPTAAKAPAHNPPALKQAAAVKAPKKAAVRKGAKSTPGSVALIGKPAVAPRTLGGRAGLSLGAKPTSKTTTVVTSSKSANQPVSAQQLLLAQAPRVDPNRDPAAKPTRAFLQAAAPVPSTLGDSEMVEDTVVSAADRAEQSQITLPDGLDFRRKATARDVFAVALSSAFAATRVDSQVAAEIKLQQLEDMQVCS